MSYVSDVVGIAANLLIGSGGLQTNLDALATTEQAPALQVGQHQIITQNVPVEIAERSTMAIYPSIYVYCDSIVNQLREKSRTFSGSMEMVFEVRSSRDRIDDLNSEVNLMIDGVVSTLDQNRGDWGSGIFYAGAYNIAFAGVKRGGKNFLQTAKVIFTLQVSRQ